MSKPMIRIHDVSTDEIIDREMNNSEYAQWQKEQEESQIFLQQQTEMIRKKADAEAKLAALGITAEDLKALGLV